MTRRKTILVAALAAGFIAVAAPFVIRRPASYYTDLGGLREDERGARGSLRVVLWERPAPVKGGVNMLEVDEYEPRVSLDGRLLVFTRGRPGGGADLWIAERPIERLPGDGLEAGEAGWGEPRPIAELNSPFDDMGGAFGVTGGGSTVLHFASDRPGGQGRSDLWASLRNEDGSWGPPRNLGPEVNSPLDETSPSPAADGSLLFFATNRRSSRASELPRWVATLREAYGGGHQDIHVASMKAAEPGGALLFEASSPVPGLDTEASEGAPCCAPGVGLLYFASDRPGGRGGLDLWRARLDGASIRSIENLGPAINTEAHELDPSISPGGFEIHFARRGPGEGTEDIVHSVSREVFLERESGEPYWSLSAIVSLLRRIPPYVLAALISILLVLLFARYFGRRMTKLALLTRCFLLAVLLHCLIAVWMNTKRVQRMFLAVLPPGDETVELILDAGAGEGVGLSIRDEVSVSGAGDETPDMPLDGARTPAPGPAVAVHRAEGALSLESAAPAGERPPAALAPPAAPSGSRELAAEARAEEPSPTLLAEEHLSGDSLFEPDLRPGEAASSRREPVIGFDGERAAAREPSSPEPERMGLTAGSLPPAGPDVEPPRSVDAGREGALALEPGAGPDPPPPAGLDPEDLAAAVASARPGRPAQPEGAEERARAGTTLDTPLDGGKARAPGGGAPIRAPARSSLVEAHRGDGGAPRARAIQTPGAEAEREPAEAVREVAGSGALSGEPAEGIETEFRPVLRALGASGPPRADPALEVAGARAALPGTRSAVEAAEGPGLRPGAAPPAIPAARSPEPIAAGREGSLALEAPEGAGPPARPGPGAETEVTAVALSRPGLPAPPRGAGGEPAGASLDRGEARIHREGTATIRPDSTSALVEAPRGGGGDGASRAGRIGAPPGDPGREPAELAGAAVETGALPARGAEAIDAVSPVLRSGGPAPAAAAPSSVGGSLEIAAAGPAPGAPGTGSAVRAAAGPGLRPGAAPPAIPAARSPEPIAAGREGSLALEVPEGAGPPARPGPGAETEVTAVALSRPGPPAPPRGAGGEPAGASLDRGEARIHRGGTATIRPDSTSALVEAPRGGGGDGASRAGRIGAPPGDPGREPPELAGTAVETGALPARGAEATDAVSPVLRSGGPAPAAAALPAPPGGLEIAAAGPARGAPGAARLGTIGMSAFPESGAADAARAGGSAAALGAVGAAPAGPVVPREAIVSGTAADGIAAARARNVLALIEGAFGNAEPEIAARTAPEVEGERVEGGMRRSSLEAVRREAPAGAAGGLVSPAPTGLAMAPRGDPIVSETAASLRVRPAQPPQGAVRGDGDAGGGEGSTATLARLLEGAPDAGPAPAVGSPGSSRPETASGAGRALEPDGAGVLDAFPARPAATAGLGGARSHSTVAPVPGSRLPGGASGTPEAAVPDADIPGGGVGRSGAPAPTRDALAAGDGPGPGALPRAGTVAGGEPPPPVAGPRGAASREPAEPRGGSARAGESEASLAMARGAPRGPAAAGLPGTETTHAPRLAPAPAAAPAPLLAGGGALAVAPPAPTPSRGGAIASPLSAAPARSGARDAGSSFVPKVYALREKGRRGEALRAGGGGADTEKAVERGLRWLARHQSPDGRWDLFDYTAHLDEVSPRDLVHGDWDGRGRKDSRGGSMRAENGDTAATGLAVLAFLGHGDTHLKDGPFRENVRRGLSFILGAQRRDGDLRGGGNLYMHAIAAFALCEAYAVTRDSALAEPAKRAVGYTLRSQNPDLGGWRYDPHPEGEDVDTSVFGWMLMALKSAKVAGVGVPEQYVLRMQRYLDSARMSRDGGRYAYQPALPRTSLAMTAQGFFSSQVLAELLPPEDGEEKAGYRRAAEESIAHLLKNKPARRDQDGGNEYYWYYATLALFQEGGPAWKSWNETLKEVLLGLQLGDDTGSAAGSWDPISRRAQTGGRVYSTAMAVLCLEVYYRYAPGREEKR